VTEIIAHRGRGYRQGSPDDAARAAQRIAGMMPVFATVSPELASAPTRGAGAAPATATTRIATQEALSGKAVDRLAKISDEQYQTASSVSCTQVGGPPAIASRPLEKPCSAGLASRG